MSVRCCPSTVSRSSLVVVPITPSTIQPLGSAILLGSLIQCSAAPSLLLCSRCLRHIVRSRLALAAALLSLSFRFAAHGEDGIPSSDMAMSSGTGGMPSANASAQRQPSNVDLFNEPSYAGLSQHSGMLLAHVVLMILAWVFVLPLGALGAADSLRELC